MTLCVRFVADAMVAQVRALTAAGYRQYEVSNFALPGHECAHNLAYWRAGADGALRGWRAFGCAAASHTPAAGGSGGATPGRRFTRPRTVAEYSAWVARGCDEREGGGGEGEASEPLAEALMMGLRLVEGVPLGPLRDAHGAAAAAAVAGALGGRHAAAGLAAVEEEAGGADGRGVARLTSPEGFLLSNSLISDVLAEVDRARRREARSAATAAAAATAEAGARARAQAQAGGA